MLRITRALRHVHSVTLKLEGNITDDWVNLLERECRAWISQKHSVCLDFSDVSYVDPSGVEMMGKLPIGKVSIINSPDFITDLLHLRGRP